MSEIDFMKEFRKFKVPINKRPLKYEDLPKELKIMIDFKFNHNNISRSQNPTVRHVVSKLKDFEDLHVKKGDYVLADKKRKVIDMIEEYIQLKKFNTEKFKY